MDDTCEFEKCIVARKFKFKSASECFNNVQSIWHKKETGEQIAVCDCAPKRTLLLTMELQNRLIAVQKSQEQQRNAMRPIAKLATFQTAMIEELQGEKLCHVENQEVAGADGDEKEAVAEPLNANHV